jgi:hypothetical protein
MRNTDSTEASSPMWALMTADIPPTLLWDLVMTVDSRSLYAEEPAESSDWIPLRHTA